jgi:lysophospholipase L1-like esterase
VWAFHSEDDTVVKPRRSRDMIAALRAKGGQPKYFEYFNAGHGSWGPAYNEPELLPWMFAQRLGQPDTFTLQTKPPEVPAFARIPETDDSMPGVGPVRRHDWFRRLWQQKRLAWSRRTQADRGAVVFLGDSITQGWGDDMGKSFGALKVANRGISGDTTRGVLYRMKEDVLDLKPRAVVLLIGTNDLEEKAAPATIATNLALILVAFEKHDPKMPVIVCHVMPSSASKSRPADKIRDINTRLDTLIKGRPQFTRCDSWTPLANPDGDARPDDFPDLLHPNKAGYAKWAAALQPIFTELKLNAAP